MLVPPYMLLQMRQVHVNSPSVALHLSRSPLKQSCSIQMGFNVSHLVHRPVTNQVAARAHIPTNTQPMIWQTLRERPELKVIRTAAGPYKRVQPLGQAVVRDVASCFGRLLDLTHCSSFERW
jgi:hypothetical protein